jgi:hypothetical protein
VKGRKRPKRNPTSYKTTPPDALSSTMKIINQTEAVKNKLKIDLFGFWLIVTYLKHKMGTKSNEHFFEKYPHRSIACGVDKESFKIKPY